VFDEILVAGYYMDAGLNEIWYFLVVDPDVTTATLTLAQRKISLDSCTNVEMGPWVPSSNLPEFTGVSIHLCGSTYK